MNRIYWFFGGRSTFFALWFFVVGCVLAFHDKLSANYVALAGAIQALIAVRSVAQDHHDRQNGNGGNGAAV